MVLRLPVNEAVEIIKVKTYKLVSLRTVNAHTINIGYEVSVKLPLIGNKSKNISIDFIIDKVVDTDIYLRYSTGMATGDNVIKALLSYFLITSDTKVVSRDVDGHIAVHLKEVKEMENILEKVKINSISFEQDTILVDFSPKI